MTVVRPGGLRWRTRALARGVRGFLLGPPPPPPPPVIVPRPPSKGPGITELVRATPRPSVHEAFRLNLIVPSVAEASIFGGVQTAIDLFRSVSAGGVRRRIISIEALDASTAISFADFETVDLTEDPDHPSQIVSVAPPAPASIPIGPRDVFIATFWPTALFALEIRAWQAATFRAAPKAFAYLVQDFEPGFYPRSAQNLLSSSTYEAPRSTIAIFNTSLLQRDFHAAGLRFADEFSFEPRLAPALRDVLAVPARERSRTIVAYGRPSKPRNAFGLIVDGLRAWRATTPDAGDWRIVSVGEQHLDVDLGGGVVLHSLGKLSLDAYADLVRTSAIGISLMISPHPSYPPLEMSYLGLLVLTNRFGEKDLATWHPNISSLTSTTAHGLASDLAALCRRFESDPLGRRSSAAARDGIPGDGTAIPVLRGVDHPAGARRRRVTIRRIIAAAGERTYRSAPTRSLNRGSIGPGGAALLRRLSIRCTTMAVGALLVLSAFAGGPAAAGRATMAATGAPTIAPARTSTDLSSTPRRGGVQQHPIAHGSLARSSQRTTSGSVPRLPTPLSFRSPAAPSRAPGYRVRVQRPGRGHGHDQHALDRSPRRRRPGQE